MSSKTRPPGETLAFEPQIASQADLCSAMAELAWIDTRETELKAECDRQVEAIKSRYQGLMRLAVEGKWDVSFADRQAVLTQAIEAYCNEHQSELVKGKGRSREFTHGVVSWKKSPEGVKVVEGRTKDDLTEEFIDQHALRPRLHELLESITVDGQPGAKDLRHLRHALGWAVARKYLPAIPVFPTVARTRKGSDMKGRPITDAEFARMIQAVPAVVGSHRAESFEHMIRGLWLSGLRLSEAASLRWTPGDWPSLNVENPRRPAIRFPDGGQNSGEAQVAPLTPDFGEFIARAEDRSGRVFRPLSPTGKPLTAVSEISRTISAIGKAAKVIVDETTKKPASAHDLRRSFGTRWAARVMPAILKNLMRHKSIEITLRYYVGQDLDRTHDAILRAMDTTLSTTPAETHVDAT